MNKNNNNFTPVATYDNADTDKLKIYLDNKGKSGIYCVPGCSALAPQQFDKR
jgi:hypothetical protein